MTRSTERTEVTNASGKVVASDPGNSPLAAALHAFQSALPVVHKGNRAIVPTKAGGKYTYTYADLSDVTAAAIPRLNEFGLTFTSRPRLTSAGGYELVGILRHVSGEFDEGSLPLFGREMQELGGSLTYARRYLLGCMTGLVTDDDEDGAFTSTPARVVTEDPAEAQTPASKPHVDAITERIATLDDEQKKDLTAAWQKANLPRKEHLSPQQATVVQGLIDKLAQDKAKATLADRIGATEEPPADHTETEQA